MHFYYDQLTITCPLQLLLNYLIHVPLNSISCCFFFFVNLQSPVSAANMHRGSGPSTRSLASYQDQHPYRNQPTPPIVAVNYQCGRVKKIGFNLSITYSEMFLELRMGQRHDIDVHAGLSCEFLYYL